MCHCIAHYDLPELEEVYMSGLAPISPDDNIRKLFSGHQRLSRWWAFLWGAYADREELKAGPSAESTEPSRVITLGPSSRIDSLQLDFSEASSRAVD